jgi:hypothetical protein
VVAQVIIDTSSGLGFEQLGTDIIMVENPFQVFHLVFRDWPVGEDGVSFFSFVCTFD